MCAGAILNSRISKLYYGAKDSRLGSCGSVINLFMENYGSSPEIYGGILEEQCAEELSKFFKKLREK
jgi:tRNA(adenine34) deaminase